MRIHTIVCPNCGMRLTVNEVEDMPCCCPGVTWQLDAGRDEVVATLQKTTRAARVP